MQRNEIEWKTLKPTNDLHDFVESFWMIENHSDKGHQIIILPDGRFDIIFSLTENKIFKVTLKGLDTEPKQTNIPANTTLFAISFKLLAVEYLLREKVKDLLNEGIPLPKEFLGISQNELNDFNSFYEIASTKIAALIKLDIDTRKRELFNYIYSSNGTLTVKELSEKVYWSSRQINRYFNKTFGISLQAYCKIFRFKSSLNHIKKGKLFPELNFADQTHFIKEVKKMSGVTPKELSKNENDRFILLSTLT
ncbi:AraC-like DNA-binding protein [Chryseobacterium ginsenosidimutans]|uniref:AraC family transcriptional regulator n=1 Tax=Chryseobacterium ginsenosidimutans TaxID=687846 RepID=UPI00278003A1|nr:AraC family transcriptional regulator [Chryseobacterium ginsenosidimutans]MDQ0593509.1 AraC-like DNA-binding protein [Chryseobacterium ginsenosidimutans]